MPEAKQQFNVSLPADLIRRLKHRAIDTQRSLSDLMTEIAEAYLAGAADGLGAAGSPKPGPLRLQPMLHVEDMTASVRFFETLGGRLAQGSRDGDWVLLRLGDAELSLLAHPPNPEQDEGLVELNFEYVGSLAELEERLLESGVFIARPTSDEGFGRQLQLLSPDGLLIKVNELDPELYT